MYQNNAQQLLYVRYVHEENVEEELLFCRCLKSHSKGEDIFFKVDEFFTTAGLQWENCIAVCTDGAGAMMDKRRKSDRTCNSGARYVYSLHDP